MNWTARVRITMGVLIVVAGTGAALAGARAARSPVGTQPNQDPHAENHRHESVDSHEEEHNEKEPQDRAQADHDGHGHEEVPNSDHADEVVRDEHNDEPAVPLSFEERRKFGIEVATAGSGKLVTHIRLPGEIVLNADRVAHIVPRAPGVVRQVRASVGDTVRAHEVMAWLESAELGEAKVDYLAKWAEVGCCTLDLVRAQEVHDNTSHLLTALQSSPSLETLRDMSGSATGENRGVLVSAYAELVLAEAAYRRERPLFEKKVASERDYQEAEAAFKKADALYAATRDSIDFKIRRELLEARQTQRMHEIELKGARRRLYILGLTSDEITQLEAHVQFQATPKTQHSGCTDPNCTNCKKTEAKPLTTTVTPEAEEKLAWYPLRAPFEGTVIEKHLTLGEKHSDESGAFTVADLSSVWVDIAVYQRDLAYVKKGMTVSVSAGDVVPSAEATIVFVSPVVDHKTRTALARVVLPNPHGEIRPGLFVNALIAVGNETATVVIPKSAVQRLGEQPIVFLETAGGLRPAPVSLGRSSASRVEILSGLDVGQRYVTHGAFELKAKIVTSGLDAHAGHGH